MSIYYILEGSNVNPHILYHMNNILYISSIFLSVEEYRPSKLRIDHELVKVACYTARTQLEIRFRFVTFREEEPVPDLQSVKKIHYILNFEDLRYICDLP